MEIIAVTLFALFVLWLARKILIKAGLEPNWAFCLLIPIVNIIMLWVFAFCHWPNLSRKIEDEINH